MNNNKTIKLAADLGQQNIPAPLVQQLIQAQTLYWRVASNYLTIEVWTDTDGNFLVLEGDFSTGAWGIDNIQIAYKAKSLSDAQSYVRSMYMITEDDGQAVASIQTKRLIKKSERRP